MAVARPARRSGGRIDYYEQAVALDSTFVQAWAQLSRAHSAIYNIGTPTPADAARRSRGGGAGLATGTGTARGSSSRWATTSSSSAMTRPRRSRSTRRGSQMAPANADLLERRWPRRAEPGTLGGVRRALHAGPTPSIPGRRSTRGAGRRPALAPALPRGGRAFDAALALSPGNLLLHSGRAMVRPGAGRSGRARGT